ncbi:NAD(P)/FAD-dependent oxidoreductase [Elongatibacter sediminis]|uniref:FAD-dependent oxidoreductase n=1 Tax=Elongatibacter sediminis TaxID=3119006 RepID=A0AAW9RAH4_9GAMM
MFEQQKSPTPGGEPGRKPGVDTPSALKDVIVIGAGMAGVSAARVLTSRGLNITLVDKARGAGGRMSTRRHDEWRFDHGAQYFTARNPEFKRLVDTWIEARKVYSWTARIAVASRRGIKAAADSTERFIPVPGMNALCSDAARQLPDVRFGWKCVEATRDGDFWRLTSEDGHTLRTRALLLTLPPDQAAQLVGFKSIRRTARFVNMRPCWTLMTVFDRPLLADYDAAFVNSGPLSWICAQSARPGRPEDHAWVLQAGPEWSQRHLESDPESVTKQLLAAVQELPGRLDARPVHTRAHRWRYALAENPLHDGLITVDGHSLVLAGDWLCGSRVEGAWTSGACAARYIADSLAPDSRRAAHPSA